MLAGCIVVQFLVMSLLLLFALIAYMDVWRRVVMLQRVCRVMDSGILVDSPQPRVANISSWLAAHRLVHHFGVSFQVRIELPATMGSVFEPSHHVIHRSLTSYLVPKIDHSAAPFVHLYLLFGVCGDRLFPMGGL